MYQKLQVGRGLNIAPSDTIDIPNPAAQALSGTSTGSALDDIQAIKGAGKAGYLLDLIKRQEKNTE